MLFNATVGDILYVQYIIHLPSDLGGSSGRKDYVVISLRHSSIILSVILCWAPYQTPSGLRALNSEGKGQWKVEQKRAWQKFEKFDKSQFKKILMTSRKEEKSVSWPLDLSIMSCFTQQLFTHSGVSSVSLSVSHLVCNTVSSFVIQSASLTVSRSSSLPVTQIQWISRSFASWEVMVRLFNLTAFYSFINQ